MCSYLPSASNILSQLKNIDVEDLQYVESDLCFYELVSVGFLLFGKERSSAEFILQKLLIFANNQGSSSDILRTYALHNTESWRENLVESLAIIQAKRVLRRLGFKWQELRQYFLPHIVELSVYIQPLLKALYKMCETLTPSESGRLVLDINEKQNVHCEDHLRFYDFQYLEIYLLSWLTRSLINVGDANLNGANVQVLIDYFKIRDMDTIKILLTETIKTNCEKQIVSGVREEKSKGVTKGVLSTDEVIIKPISRIPKISIVKSEGPNDDIDCYSIRREYAGIVMIINQKEFHQNVPDNLKHLLPEISMKTRIGTDLDRDRLATVFHSFGYKPEIHENLNHIDLLHNVRETVKRSFVYDSIIICILSHGLDGAVYGSDSIPLQIVDIEKILSEETLKDKPKILIIQACQKDQPSPELQKSNSTTRVNAHDYLDILKGMSTLSGFDSMRDTKQGTWYIQLLCETIDALGDRNHLFDILTLVTNKVTKKRGDKNEIMTPAVNSTLRKLLRLPPRPKDVCRV